MICCFSVFVDEKQIYEYNENKNKNKIINLGKIKTNTCTYSYTLLYFRYALNYKNKIKMLRQFRRILIVFSSNLFF